MLIKSLNLKTEISVFKFNGNQINKIVGGPVLYLIIFLNLQFLRLSEMEYGFLYHYIDCWITIINYNYNLISFSGGVNNMGHKGYYG